jgi:hypothetical protein
VPGWYHTEAGSVLAAAGRAGAAPPGAGAGAAGPDEREQAAALSKAVAIIKERRMRRILEL